MGALHRLLDPARHLALGLRDVEGLVHGLVPGLFLGGDVHRRLAGLIIAFAVSRAGVHDLSGAGGVVALRRIGRTVIGFVVAVLALAVVVLAVAVLTAAVAGGGIGLVVGVLVIAVGRGLAGGRSPMRRCRSRSG